MFGNHDLSQEIHSGKPVSPEIPLVVTAWGDCSVRLQDPDEERRSLYFR